MAGVTGIGSGIDIDSIVASMVAAETQFSGMTAVMCSACCLSKFTMRIESCPLPPLDLMNKTMRRFFPSFRSSS